MCKVAPTPSLITISMTPTMRTNTAETRPESRPSTRVRREERRVATRALAMGKKKTSVPSHVASERSVYIRESCDQRLERSEVGAYIHHCADGQENYLHSDVSTLVCIRQKCVARLGDWRQSLRDRGRRSGQYHPHRRGRRRWGECLGRSSVR